MNIVNFVKIPSLESVICLAHGVQISFAYLLSVNSVMYSVQYKYENGVLFIYFYKFFPLPLFSHSQFFLVYRYE